MSKEIKIQEKQNTCKEFCQKIKNKCCQCQPVPNWVKWLAIVLIITIFLIACVQLHYLWKLSDIWQAIKGSK